MQFLLAHKRFFQFMMQILNDEFRFQIYLKIVFPPVADPFLPADFGSSSKWEPV